MLPAKTNWTGIPRLATLRAQPAASRAKLLAAPARISAAILSLWLQAANTSSAKPAIALLSAACAQSIRSFGSFSNSARSSRRPKSGQADSWS
jgi:hypothetical protein